MDTKDIIEVLRLDLKLPLGALFMCSLITHKRQWNDIVPKFPRLVTFAEINGPKDSVPADARPRGF